MKKSNVTAEEIIPEQKTGSYTGATATVELNSRNEAVELFKVAKSRLLNINNWDEYSGAASATFELTDSNGKGISAPPQTRNLIRIDVPGPGTFAGQGFDWVCIEAIEDGSDPDAENEFFAFRVRPAKNPDASDDAPSHFYTDDATSTFIIERNGNTVSASEKGRNEESNTETGNILDKARNVIVATGAKNGAAYPQWKSLMEGLLKMEE
ncbi:MAG: hypothetical protein WAQ28_06060 [Bacteroidia bacterium]